MPRGALAQPLHGFTTVSINADQNGRTFSGASGRVLLDLADAWLSAGAEADLFVAWPYFAGPPNSYRLSPSMIVKPKGKDLAGCRHLIGHFVLLARAPAGVPDNRKTHRTLVHAERARHTAPARPPAGFRLARHARSPRLDEP